MNEEIKIGNLVTVDPNAKSSMTRYWWEKWHDKIMTVKKVEYCDSPIRSRAIVYVNENNGRWPERFLIGNNNNFLEEEEMKL